MRNKELNCKDEWSEKTLYDLGTISRGKSKHRPRNDAILYNGQYPFIQTADVKSSNLYINTFSQTYNDIGLAQSKLWDKGTLCITIAANIADASILDFDACFPDSILGFTPREGISDVRFIKYCFDLLQADIKKQSKGSTQDNLSLDKLSQIKFNVPSFPTQKKIADVLSCIDDKIALNNKTNTELENMAKTIYDYWFTQFDFPDKNGHPYKTSGGQMVYNEILKREIPTGWEGLKLEKCLSRIATGLNPRDNFVLGNGNIKYLTVKNLNTDGTIDFSNCDLIDEEALKLVHARSDIRKGDILFASIAPLGRCYLIQDTPKGWDINESVFSIRPNTDLISSIYLYMFFMDESFVKLAQSNSTGSVFKGIRINDLYSIPILVPEKQIMEKFSETITPIMNMKYRVEKENKELIELRDYLLPLLMNGQIEVK